MCRNKFTLIELLVVVAIIGILASMLLPSMSKAREAAKRSVCLSNNHQIYLAIVNYTDDGAGDLPPGNATIGSGHGIDSTYVVPPKKAYGLAILLQKNYLDHAGIFYCPSWTHPDKNYGVIDSDGSDQSFGANAFGGFPKDLESGPWPTAHVGISYHYRSTFGSGTNEPALMSNAQPGDTAINADHWTRREALFGTAYGHKDAYITLYLDGHAIIKKDPRANYMQAKNSGSTHHNWGFQETVWQEFFDKN